MSLVVVRGEVTWNVRRSTDAKGVAILIATNNAFRSTLWAYTEDDLTRCMGDSVQLLITHFLNHGLHSALEDRGFVVDSYTVDSSQIPGSSEVVSPVNGTTNFLHRVPAHA